MSVSQLEAPVPTVAPTAAEVQALVTRLTRRELAAFNKWFGDWFEDEWDRQIEEDALAGRLDHLMRQADADFDGGRCKPL